MRFRFRPRIDIPLTDCVMRQLKQIARHTSFDDYGYFDMEQLMELKLIERRDSKKTGGYWLVR
jgi:hypothetical protein